MGAGLGAPRLNTTAFGFANPPRKARNLARNGHCAITTANAMTSGFDVVVEGHAQRVYDTAELQRLAEAYASKCGWEFIVNNRTFRNDQGDEALAFAPVKAFDYGREGRYMATRWRFK